MRAVSIILGAFTIALLLNLSPATGGMLSTGPLPSMSAPADNPQTDAKILLGKQLYFDKRLSSDSTVNCASCHDKDAGWADPNRVSTGVGGAKGGRNAPTVLNTGYNDVQFWDGRAGTLEEQALGPIQNPVEMHMTIEDAVTRLKAIPGYVEEFKTVFGTEPNAEGIGKAIAAFERSVVSTDSPYDRYMKGDKKAMSQSAVRGEMVFAGKGHCITCHSGPNFTDSKFHNVGAGVENGKVQDEGRAKISGNPAETGAFKTPGLRSVALTGPYLHDGSEATLKNVVDFYDRGGTPNPHLSRLIVPLNLSKQEKEDLIAFMKSLTGREVKMTPPELPR